SALDLQGFPITVSGRLISNGGTLTGGPGALSATNLSGLWSGTILSTVAGSSTRTPLTFTLTHNGTALTGTSPALPGVVFNGTFAGTPATGFQEFSVTVTATNTGSCSPATFNGSIV